MVKSFNSFSNIFTKIKQSNYCTENTSKQIFKSKHYFVRAKLVMNEAELLLQINKHKSSANMDAKERMIEQFLTKVYNYEYNKHINMPMKLM